MRIIICGAGQVGYSIADYLSREGHDITVIERDVRVIGDVAAELDVATVQGHASNPNILSQAGAAEADLIIAVTNSDEVNMVVCEVAHALFNVPKKIARIRSQAYLAPEWANLFTRSHVPVDVVISPEMAVARAIYQRLRVPGTTNVVTLADGAVHMVGVLCGPHAPAVNAPLERLGGIFPDLSIEVAAILRGPDVIMPSPKEKILQGDEVYFFVDTPHLQKALAAFGHREVEARHIAIVGGGRIGLHLARLVQEENPRVRLKIIEVREERAKFLGEKLPGAVILHGNALDHEILQEANIEQTETLVAVTNDDEGNILGSLLAKRYGCERVIALVNNPGYSPLLGSMGIDVAVSPRASTVSSIMQHVRKGKIKALHTLKDGFAEVIEAEVADASDLVNVTLADLKLPQGVVLGAIVRDAHVLFPTPDLEIHARDHVIMLARSGMGRAVERMFMVHVDLF